MNEKIKLRLRDAIEAFSAAGEMLSEKMDFDSSYSLVMLRDKLKARAEYYHAEEIKLASRFAKKSDDGSILIDESGALSFVSKENEAEFARLRRELSGVELDEDIHFKMKKPEKITPRALEALAPFVEFI